MLSNPISIESPSAVPLAEGAGALPPGTSDSGERFALKLASAQAALPAGQNLAAAALPLQAWALGPTLEVLTTPSAQPDSDALAEFAKAQGLDDDVVAWLFADPALQGLPANLMTAPGAAALGATQAAPQAILDAVKGTVTGAGTDAGSPTTLESGQTLRDAASQATQAAAQAAGATTWTQAQGGALTVSAASATSASTASATATATATATAAQVGAQAGAAQSAALTLAATLTPAAAWLQQSQTSPQAAASEAANADAIDAAAAVPSFTLAGALAAAATRAKGAAGTAPQAAATAGRDALPVEVLSLEVEPELEQLWDADAASAPPAGSAAGDLDGAGSGGTGAQPQAQPGAVAPGSTIAQRADGYQALAERLGEALAQRVQSQVERGQWQIKMVIKPEKLGEIAIDLKMNAGAVDASFSAANPITRELLNDSLPKLREVLSGAGMDIADLQVANGKSQQSGGNPTPRHAQSGQGGAVTQTAPTAETAPATTAAPAARRVGGSAGWDVLV